MTTMSAAQRRAAAKADFDDYMEDCATRQVLLSLGGKWASLLMFTLAEGPRRYNDLARALPGVSAKVLTQALRSLERDGFVSREVTYTVPVQVEYTLTELGRRAIPLLAAVRDWAEENIGDVHAARAAFAGPGR
ncbi:winged helix-turn-helix transcriptional regulator [Actinomadura macrotermitis]|uniref:Putative HTH-type transcriptional regulator YybR n=1 Tax=Actinomadura macrotermitis TaxID=2585200 RepID=A0A7K0BW97_9ACTN|nr:helix-turn-helix domain-containing protein [Actinomadura macrotermitis]MQY05450.1 putative HTH-type transcriptional regulator YybR [Actinomadura macrotermitis]